MEKIPFTKEGYKTLKKELAHLKTVERPNNIKAIEEAKAHGDLSENAEFAAAKERQSFIAGRIEELNYKLGNAEIISTENLPKEKVIFGSRVLLENIDTGEEVTYQLVGPEESNIEKGKISINSPLGKSIIGKKPGVEISIQVPVGKRSYELIDII